MERSPHQLPLPFPALPDRDALPLCREAWRYCCCDACHARRLYFYVFGVPPLSDLTWPNRLAQEKPPLKPRKRRAG